MTANRIRDRALLMASLICAIVFCLLRGSDPLDGPLVALKGAAVALLAIYALLHASQPGARTIALVMALGALGDVLIERSLTAGASAFLAGHGVAIWLYLRNRRTRITASQKLLASLVVPVSVFVGAAISPPDLQIMTAIYAAFVSGMAASAWTSRFPRYRTGIGAMLFLASDLLIFARMDALGDSALPQLLIWPLYWLGQLLIVLGVIGAEQKGQASD